jgi:HEXXH motif-containing protein
MGHLQSLVILSQPGIESRQRGRSFGGATCFFFRGGTVLNVARSISVARMVELLVHEYGHAELFVLAQEQLLCLNSDDERHSVLIRSDPRPMNGIIHSLYVVGRVVDVLQQLLKDGLAAEAQRNEILADMRTILSQQLRFGHSSLNVVQQHAQLTPLGRSIVTTSSQRLARAEQVP